MMDKHTSLPLPLASAFGLLLLAACAAAPAMKPGEAAPKIDSDIAAARPTGPRIATPPGEIAAPPGEDSALAITPPVNAPERAVAPLEDGAGPAAKSPPGDPRIGRSFALDNCRPCHVVAGDQSSLVRFANAPDFHKIARAPHMTPFSLNIWLTNPHPTMPTLQLTSEEAANVIAYIMSLRN